MPSGRGGSIGGMFVAKAAGYILQATGGYWALFIIAGSAYPVALAVIHALALKLKAVQV